MKKLHILLLLIAAGECFFSINLSAQCPGGYTQAKLNWDFRDYLVSTGNYAGFVSPARAAAQRFTIGTNALLISYSGTITNNGEDETHTADAGTDLNYSTVAAAGNTALITLIFDTEAANVLFSVYDIDRRQIVTINGKNALGADVSTTIVKRNSPGLLTLTPASGTGINPSASSINSSAANTSHDGTIDVAVAGPVKTITISISNSGIVSSPELFLSSITACVTGSFPTGWRNITRPFTGMPSYILTVVDNRFMLVDPATGKAKQLFTDPGHTNMNGMGYDPYHRVLYYTYSLTATPANTVTIYKYDVDAETISTFVSDIRNAPLNIPSYDPGVTSGSASFYNGSLYFGVEASNSARTSGRENTVWKIDFDAAQNPTTVSQVYAARVDSNISGTNRLIHDWADIGVTNGILYDFDGAGTGTANRDTMYYHFDLMTGQRTQYLPSGSGNIGPKQVAIDWQDKVYNMGSIPISSAYANSATGFIAPYNYNGTIDDANSRLVYTMPGPAYPTGSWGDCSEAFRPTCDFGDAPATYDPDTWSPAVHERDTAIRIGATWDREWLKRGVTGVEDIDDGLAYTPIMSPGGGGYITEVSVYNNKGIPATLIAWLDCNGNGVFDAAEAITPISVPSSAASQNFWLYWPVTTNSFAIGQHTYLRIRMTTGAMTVSGATGYFEDGETEDYRVLVDNFPLTINLLSFTAKIADKDHVQLDWRTTGEENFTGFEVQRSADNINWSIIGITSAKGNGQNSFNNYLFSDPKPLPGKSFYRLKMISGDGKNKYSDTRAIILDKLLNQVLVSPNPASDKITVSVHSSQNLDSDIRITGMTGQTVYRQKKYLSKGINTIEIPLTTVISNGMYILYIQTSREMYQQKISINRYSSY